MTIDEYVYGTNPANSIKLEKRNDMDNAGLTSPPYLARDLGDPRQIFARQLYCLMMALKPATWNVPTDEDGDGNAGQPADTARYLAQWAVNVVDFRDADSINTRFDYDPNPFDADGWSPQNVTPPASVWGVERLEILISETLAWHDRRTEDLDNEQPEPPTDMAAKTDDANNKDPDYDQRLRPRGAFFFELFNPWYDVTQSQANGQSYVHRPMEIYANYWDYRNPAGNNLNPPGGVALIGMARDANTGNFDSPIWRVLVVRNGTGATPGTSHTLISGGGNPDMPRPESLPANDIERSIYFADPSAMITRATNNGLTLNHGTYYFSNLPVAPLLPGRYAVIGGYDE